MIFSSTYNGMVVRGGIDSNGMNSFASGERPDVVMICAEYE
jgi:hypothetical protein